MALSRTSSELGEGGERCRRTSVDVPAIPLDNSSCKFLICWSVSQFFAILAPSGKTCSVVVPSAPSTCFRTAFPFPLTFLLRLNPFDTTVSSSDTPAPKNPVCGIPLASAEVLVEDEIVSHQIASAALSVREGRRVESSVAGVEFEEVARGGEDEDEGGGLRVCRREARCDLSAGEVDCSDAISEDGTGGRRVEGETNLEVEATG